MLFSRFPVPSVVEQQGVFDPHTQATRTQLQDLVSVITLQGIFGHAAKSSGFG
jgi:hypothetical protein